MIAVRELAPGAAGGAYCSGIAIDGLVVLDEADEGHQLGADVVIDAQNLVDVRTELREQRAEVEAALTGGIERQTGGVGLREQVQHRQSGGVDAAGRNAVAGEDGLVGGGVINRDRDALRGDGLREIARAFQRRRHRERVVDDVGVAEVIHGEEEKHFGAILVEVDSGNQQRTAEGPAGIGVPVFRLGHVQLVIEPFVGVELFVAPVVKGAAVILRRTVLHAEGKLPAGAAAVLGGVVGDQQLHFGDGVDAGRHVTGIQVA